MSIRDLRIESVGGRPIVQGLDLEIPAGRRIGVVGESGSGKSMTAGAIVGLLPEGVGVVGGEIELDGRSVLDLTEHEMRSVRGRRVSIVYQNALSSLNPVVNVGTQIADVARAHLPIGKHEARRRAVRLMSELGIPDADRRALDYPHQFSGGMAQRIAIAMALVCEPDLVIADEPTTGLDATIQVQVLATIAREVGERGSALLLISHDLAAIASMAEEVVVLYAGMVLEHGSAEQIMRDPVSPYTAGLVASADPEADRISFIPGRIPDPGEIPEDSCPFAARCPLATELCRTERPALRVGSDGRRVACHNVEVP
ncbi:ABC transporter ATP-binding protein [Agromyces sp. SYSU T00194]|uniref:ABC transporter ATP-binding protein n=1 Tax=Agromyces chitinivorans TaxID=3158560 RepID=UPI003394E199